MIFEEVARDGIGSWRRGTDVPVGRNIDSGNTNSWRTHPRQVIDDDPH
jgi:hypothetical protein